MLRFLFGGLATVAGIVLLFVASFGDPAAVLHWAQTTLPFVGPSNPNDATAPPQQQPPPRPAEQADVLQSTPETPRAQAQPQAQPQVEAQAQVPPQPQPTSQPDSSQSASPALPNVPAPGNASPPPAADAGIKAQRAALQQELRKLQAETEQAAQSVSALRNQASQERQDLDALQRERAQEQHEMDRLHAAQAKAAAVREEVAQTRQPPTAAPPATASQTPTSQPTAAQTPQPQPTTTRPQLQPQPQQPQSQPQPAAPTTTQASSGAPVQTAEAGNPDLPLPPPVPPAPPPRPRVPVQTAAGNPVPHGAPPPPDDYARQTDQADNNALQAVIARLRQQNSAEAPPPYPGSQRSYADAQPPPAGYAQPESPPAQVTPTPPRAAYAPPAQPDPRQRLGLARAALVAGNVDAARQYLEEAQLQLVFRPVTPADDQPSGGSRVAGDVASALNMLGSGNSSGALEFVDRAMAEVRAASAPAPQFYGYAGGYGGAWRPQ